MIPFTPSRTLKTTHNRNGTIANGNMTSTTDHRDLVARSQTMEKELERKDQRIENLQKELQVVRSALATDQRNHRSVVVTVDKISRERTKLIHELSKCREYIGKMETQMTRLGDAKQLLDQLGKQQEHIDDLRCQVDRTSTELFEKKETIKSLTRDVDALQRTLEIQKRYDSNESADEDNAYNTIRSITYELGRKQADAHSLALTLAETTTRLDEVKETLRDVTNLKKQCEKDLSSCQDERLLLQQNHQLLTQELAETKDQHIQTLESNNELTTQVQKLTTKLTEMRTTNENVEKEKDSVAMELSSMLYNSQMEGIKLQGYVDELQKNIAHMQQASMLADEQIAAKVEQLTVERNALAELLGHEELLKPQLQSLQSQLIESHNKQQELHQYIATLESSTQHQIQHEQGIIDDLTQSLENSKRQLRDVTQREQGLSDERSEALRTLAKTIEAAKTLAAKLSVETEQRELAEQRAVVAEQMVEQLQRTNEHVSAAVLDSLQQEKQKNALLEQELQQMKANMLRNNHNNNGSNNINNNSNNNNDSNQSNHVGNHLKVPTGLAMPRYSEEPLLPEGLSSPSRLTDTAQGPGLSYRTGVSQELSSPLRSSHSSGEIQRKKVSPSTNSNHKVQTIVKPGTTPTIVSSSSSSSSSTVAVKIASSSSSSSSSSSTPTPPTSGSASKHTRDVHHHRQIHNQNHPRPTATSTPLRESLITSSPPSPPPLTPLRDKDVIVGMFPSMSEQDAKSMKSGRSPNHSSLPTHLHTSPQKAAEMITSSTTVAVATTTTTTTGASTTSVNPLDRLSDEKPLSDPLVAGLARIREHLRDIEANAPSLLEQSGLSISGLSNQPPSQQQQQQQQQGKKKKGKTNVSEIIIDDSKEEDWGMNDDDIIDMDDDNDDDDDDRPKYHTNHDIDVDMDDAEEDQNSHLDSLDDSLNDDTDPSSGGLSSIGSLEDNPHSVNAPPSITLKATSVGGVQGMLSNGTLPLSTDSLSNGGLPLPMQSSGPSYGIPSSQRSSTSSFSPRYISSNDQNHHHVSTPTASSILIRLPAMMSSPASSASNTPPRLFSTHNGITPPRFHSINPTSNNPTSRSAIQEKNSPIPRYSHPSLEREDETYRSMESTSLFVQYNLPPLPSSNRNDTSIGGLKNDDGGLLGSTGIISQNQDKDIQSSQANIAGNHRSHPMNVQSSKKDKEVRFELGPNQS